MCLGLLLGLHTAGVVYGAFCPLLFRCVARPYLIRTDSRAWISFCKTLTQNILLGIFLFAV